MTLEARLALIDYHVDKCTKAMRDLRVALENFEAAVRLESRSQTVRLSEVLAAAGRVDAANDAMVAMLGEVA